MENQFLSNYSETTFLDKIKSNLSCCNSFDFSVSFIKKAGLVLLSKDIEEAILRGAKGRLITSTYQNFTDIESLRYFLELAERNDNFECHLDFNCFDDNGFHTKGYLFEYDNSYEIVVGSSNITRFALLKNKEWNVSLITKEASQAYRKAEMEFLEFWDKTYALSSRLIENYREVLEFSIEKWDMDYYNPECDAIKPNAMQRKALKEIRRYRDLGASRSLVVAATGSGKTYLAAFDAKNFGASRVLFVVHRDTILNEAYKAFANVFGSAKSYGKYTGTEKGNNADFVFAGTSMLLKHLDDFAPDEFDYIVYDEAHHMASDGGLKIIQYFKPEFLLGLTATPERMDQKDVFSLFEYNVPFELRLRDAITTDLVVPFHYYAIRDEYVDYSTEDKRAISREITKQINVNFIAEQIKTHKKPNEKLKALAFCTDLRHCREMSDKLNEVGFSALPLTGSNNTGERIKAFNDLQRENNPLEIICAVDILNEGIDIPGVNMVVFLRPTESQTIFLQQLGRGLRKYNNKDYLTVLDFIGNNYGRSVQIALALGSLGKTTYAEKTYLTDLVLTDFKALNIPNVEIFFDELSKTEIIKHLSSENFNRERFLKKDYENFKKYIGKETYPSHMDYLNSDISPDLMRFIKSKLGKKNKSYYSFLSKIGEDTIPTFSEEEIALVDEISELLPIVRQDEFLIIRQLISNSLDIKELSGFSSRVDIGSLNHACEILRKKEIVVNDKLNVSSISKALAEYLSDLCEYALTRYETEFGEYDGTFKLYANYFKEQVMLVSRENALLFMKGTKFYNDGTTYVFIGLKKDKSKEERNNYKDKFISSDLFQWESENNTTEDSPTGRKLLSTKTVHLFVRKMDDEDGITLPFTYFGTGKFENMRKSFVTVREKLNGKEVSKDVDTLLFDIRLDNTVPSDYYLDFAIPQTI